MVQREQRALHKLKQMYRSSRDVLRVCSRSILIAEFTA